jgi:hypothetical protein
VKHKVFYKVITRKDRLSAIIRDKDLRVGYPINVWVRSNIPMSPLMVFKRKPDARAWANNMMYDNRHRELIVVPCIVKNPNPVKILWGGDVTRSGIRMRKSIVAFWEIAYMMRRKKLDALVEYLYNKRYSVLNRTPRGSFAVSAVKCLA